jgi:hypothetical protein
MRLSQCSVRVKSVELRPDSAFTDAPGQVCAGNAGSRTAGAGRHPVFGRQGRLLTTPGYHPDARLLYCPALGFEVEAIAERPSAEELSAARMLICEDLFGDFPFVALRIFTANEKAVGALARKCCEGRVDLTAGAGFEHLDLQPHGAGSRFRVS